MNNLTKAQQLENQQMTVNITHSNTAMLQYGRDYMVFDSIESIIQGAGALHSICTNFMGTGPSTLDMDGRSAAISLIQNMATGFSKITISDPSRLVDFVKGILGSTLAILATINKMLYYNDPSYISMSDMLNAADMPYDTDIPDDSDPDIPTDPDVALSLNA